jgi:glutathione S-transferase
MHHIKEESTVTLKLYFSPASPFVRKVLVCAHEVGIADQIERLDCAVSPINRDRNVVAANPLGKIPTLFAHDGTALFDSRVICEYINAQGGGQLFPSEPGARWRALRDQSLADGLLDAAILARYETSMRPPEYQWPEWQARQLDKVTSCLDCIEAEAAGYLGRVDIGTIAVGCALGYMDFRYAHLAWRTARPNASAWFARFGERKSMQMTKPVDRNAMKR